MAEQEYLTVKQAAERLGCHPKALSQTLYHVDPFGRSFEVVGHRRRIPVNTMPELQRQLELRGVLDSPKPIV